ncbi:hypothetical protein L1987_09069 [Smallanthus sonchifolius]|uniref:Uncharacterized protein n=1 Tax=Smallanthus sonchifolius TaxID=185202 RepID=A0ACB9JP07_9ASTR|nr:hypothetical protein L1987_09069 [Smallanthus sonchifolius]
MTTVYPTDLVCLRFPCFYVIIGYVCGSWGANVLYRIYVIIGYVGLLSGIALLLFYISELNLGISFPNGKGDLIEVTIRLEEGYYL